MDPSSSQLLLPADSKIFQHVQPSDFSAVGQRRRPSPADEEEEEELDDELEAATKNKKRRLTAKQVQSLEKSFEVDHKLEPHRKIKLAVELNLRPRQVAIWFQNRRARSKTKQLHRDYAALKSHYDQLINHNNQLQNEVSFLKDELSKLEGKSNTGAAGPAEEAISDVLDSGGSPSQEDLTASCLMEELGKALEADFQMGAGAGGFELPGFDFDPSYDAAYWSWLY